MCQLILSIASFVESTFFFSLQCVSMQICLKFNVFALQNFLGGHHHKSAPSTPRNPDEDQWNISALEREKVNKAIEFMFVGINMFWVQLRLILAQANLATI